MQANTTSIVRAAMKPAPYDLAGSVDTGSQAVIFPKAAPPPVFIFKALVKGGLGEAPPTVTEASPSVQQATQTQPIIGASSFVEAIDAVRACAAGTDSSQPGCVQVCAITEWAYHT